MRTYSIDQLNDDEVAKIHARLQAMNLQAGLEGIYWLPIPKDMHTSLQKEHLSQCGPYCLALDVEGDAIHLELLVRGQGRIRCDCICHAGKELREYMINYLDTMLADLGVTF